MSMFLKILSILYSLMKKDRELGNEEMSSFSKSKESLYIRFFLERLFTCQEMNAARLRLHSEGDNH